MAGSLHVGWAECRGSFIARLDADDEADPSRLVKQLQFLEQHPEATEMACNGYVNANAGQVSVVAGRVSSFFSEQRKFSVEKISQKEDRAWDLCAQRVFRWFYNVFPFSFTVFCFNFSSCMFMC